MKNLIVLFSLCIYLSSCVAPTQVTSSETYKSDSFSAREIADVGMAVLPVTAGADLEGFRRPFGDELNRVSSGLFKNVISWNETMSKLNEMNLVEDYQRLIQTYNETSILDKKITQKIADGLGVKYLLYVRLAPPDNSQSVGYNAISGDTYVSEKRTVAAYGKIWDKEGDVEWEGIVNAVAVSGAYTYVKDDNATQAQKAANALARRIAGLDPEKL